MFSRIFKRASSFRSDERGVVLILFAVLMVPILMLVALAIDYGQFLVMKNQLAASVDAAALDVARFPNLTDDQALAKANAFVAANYPASTAIGTLQSLTVTRGTSTVDVTAVASLNTTFMKIAGVDTLSANVHSQVVYQQNKLEVVLVLDNTGSMAAIAGTSTKIDGLKTAATELTNILFGSSDTSQFVKIGVAPFTAAVNVGPIYRNAAWIDSTGATMLTTENLDVPAGNSLFSLFDQFTNASWRGCVRQRIEPYDLQETPPDPATPDTLFTPYFAPDEPDSGSFSNSYLRDGAPPPGNTPQAIQRNIAKYAGAALGNKEGPNTACPVKSILRLSNQKQPVLDEINGMTPKGNTVIPAGLMWGWHLLSPNGPFGDGAPYSDEVTIKAIVLVTDGDNSINGGGNGFNKSVFNSYGYAGAGGHLTIDPKASPEGNLNEKLLSLCANIQALKTSKNNPRIILYMIALGDDIDQTAQSLLQQCATDSTTYFTTSTTDALISTFQSIAAGLNQLRVSK